MVDLLSSDIGAASQSFLQQPTLPAAALPSSIDNLINQSNFIERFSHGGSNSKVTNSSDGTRVRREISPETDRQLKEASIEFEAVFLANMLEPLFKDIEPASPFGGGNAEKTYNSLLVQEYAKEMAKGGGVGIAESVYEELVDIQERKLNGAPNLINPTVNPAKANKATSVYQNTQNGDR